MKKLLVSLTFVCFTSSAQIPTGELQCKGDIAVGGNATITGSLAVDSPTLQVNAATNTVTIGGAATVTGSLTVDTSVANSPIFSIPRPSDSTRKAFWAEVDSSDNTVFNTTNGKIHLNTNWGTKVGDVPGNTMTLTHEGKVGIGTAAPSYLTHIKGATPTLCIDNSSASSSGVNTLLFTGLDGNSNQRDVVKIIGEQAGNGGYGQIRLQTAFNNTLYDRVTVTKDGNVGIGTASPGYLLDLLSTGDARKTGAHWVDLSDERMKTDITQLGGAIAIIKQLRGVTFKWKEEAKKGETDKTHIGLIAQEVETVLPEWTTTDSEGFKHVKIGNDTALFIEAFKEQQAQIDALTARLDKLEKRGK